MNRHHIKLNTRSDITTSESILGATEAEIDCGRGRAETWDGRTVLHLMREIRAIHGRLWTAHDSQHNLQQMEQKAEADPNKVQFTSMAIRLLALSAMNLTDTGYLHTRDPMGLENAIKNRQRYTQASQIVAKMSTKKIRVCLKRMRLLDGILETVAAIAELGGSACGDQLAKQALALAMLRSSKAFCEVESGLD